MSTDQAKPHTPAQATWILETFGVDVTGNQNESSAVSRSAEPSTTSEKQKPPVYKAALVANNAKDVQPAPGDDKESAQADDTDEVEVAYKPGSADDDAPGGGPARKPHPSSPHSQHSAPHLPTNRADAILDTVDKGIDVADKLVTLGTRVYGLMKNSKSLTVADPARVSVIPEGAKWTELVGGQPSGDVRYSFSTWPHNALSDVSIIFQVQWLHSVSYKGTGQYIKSATVIVADVSIVFGHDVSINVEFGDPYQGPGGTKGNPVAMLPVKITVTDDWAVFTTSKTYTGVLKGSGGYENHSIS